MKIAQFLRSAMLAALLPCFALCSASLAEAQSFPLIQNPAASTQIELNGDWHYIVDPYENGYYDYRYQPKDAKAHPGPDAYFMNHKPSGKGEREEYDFDLSPTMQIPGDWNSQDEKLFYYEGTVWFKKSFDYHKQFANNRVFLRVGAANYEAQVYLNGHKLGSHIGGFTPFNFEVTQQIQEGSNFVVIKVDNKRRRDGVPTLNTDWWNYGGITRPVSIIETPPTFIRNYRVQLAKGKKDTIEGYIQLDGPDASRGEVQLSIAKLGQQKRLRTDANGRAEFVIDSKVIERWAPGKPVLYDVLLQAGEHRVLDRIGFRNIAVSGADILINDKPVFLRGISIHEENPLRGGRAWSEDDARLLLGWARDLGANFVRLAHYPHNDDMLKIADEMGMMVWGEIPVYWTILWDDKSVYENAENQLATMIERDKNRAAVIIWSLANETPRSDGRLAFLKRLAKTARRLDNSRLISAALEKHDVKGKTNVVTVDDRFADDVDLLAFNQYIGWYDGSPEKCSQVQWQIKQNKPVFISEFGGGALQGYHGDRDTMWSEEHQAWLYEECIAMLKKIPQLRGMSPWILVDFRSPRRNLPGIQDGWNRKGLLSNEGKPKQAWSVLNQFYRSMED